MILQALTSLYEALAQKGEISKEGWSREKISFALSIDEEGNLLRVTPLFDTVDGPKGKTREVPQKMTVPAAVKRTSGAAAKFLWDNSSYILGVSLKKGENDAEREKRRNKDIKCFEACRELHHSMLDGMEYPAAKAVLNFLDKWEPQKAEENNLVAQYAKEILSGANMVFRFNGGYVHDDPQLASVWQKANAKQKDNIGQCLVTGALDEIQKTHPTIKGVQGVKPRGAPLVSFNVSAFCSYNKEQNQNAPVGKYAAFAYTTALNHLLADRKNVHRIGDAAVVCWAENADKQYEDFAAEVFFGDNVDKSDEQRLSALRTSLKLLADGLPCKEMDLDPDRKFYILGLSPNAARIAVRFFYCDSFGKIAGNTLQLCGQAMCLEEMLACDIPRGALFYGETRRRVEVEFDRALRDEVRDVLSEMHDLYSKRYTPKVKPTKACASCSMKEICLPKLMKTTTVATYINKAMEES